MVAVGTFEVNWVAEVGISGVGAVVVEVRALWWFSHLSRTS